MALQGFTPASGVTFIVVTGGPCAGKTEFMKRVIALLVPYGLRVAVIPEAATYLMEVEGANRSDSDFQDRVLAFYLEAEEQYQTGIYAGQYDVVLMDRGPLDSRAYVGNSAFSEVAFRAGLTDGQLRARYHAVVHLVTAANGAEEFYNHSNAVRTESPEEARERDERLRQAWHGHRHHIVIGNETDFETKLKRALRALRRVLKMPAPLEIERKFIFARGFNPIFLKQVGPVTVVPTEQAYLLPQEDGFLPRIRKQVRDARLSYILERKRETGVMGIREEVPQDISEKEYAQLMEQRDRSRAIIRKDRHVFFFEDGYHRGELDQFHGDLEGLWVLEVELMDMEESLVLPTTWDLLEVTNNPRFGNYELAAHGMPSAA